VKDETLENDLGDMLIEGERAGIVSKDGEGEAESVGEPMAEGIGSGIEGGILRIVTNLRLTVSSLLVSCDPRR
jgi:transcription elongation factor